MGRIIGIDFGTKRIGLAITDPLKIFASPLVTVTPGEFFSYIENFMRTEEVDAFVIGYPVQMNNKPSESVIHLKPFIKKIGQKFPGKEIFLEDERFTSQMALRSMIDGGVKKSDRRDKALVDKISASIILQSYLDNRHGKTEKTKER